MQKIIIVEDDQFLREELENIYHKAGYEVCCVKIGRASCRERVFRAV